MILRAHNRSFRNPLRPSGGRPSGSRTVVQSLPFGSRIPSHASRGTFSLRDLRPAEMSVRRPTTSCAADQHPAVRAVIKARVDELCRRAAAGEPLFRPGEIFSVRQALRDAGYTPESFPGLN